MTYKDSDTRALLGSIMGGRIRTLVISGPVGSGKTFFVKQCLSQYNFSYVHIPPYISNEEIWGTLDFENSIRSGKAISTHGLVGRKERIWYVEDWTRLDRGIQQSLMQAVKEQEKILLTTVVHGDEQIGASFWEDVDIHIYKENPNHERRKEVMLCRECWEGTFLTEQPSERMECYQGLKEQLCKVEISDDLLHLIGHYVVDGHVRGNRTESVLVETSRALAAIDGQCFVSPKHIEEAATYVLPHKMNMSMGREDEMLQKYNRSSNDAMNKGSSSNDKKDIEREELSELVETNECSERSNSTNVNRHIESTQKTESIETVGASHETVDASEKKGHSFSSEFIKDEGDINTKESSIEVNGEFFLSLIQRMERLKKSALSRSNRKLVSGKRYKSINRTRYGHYSRTVRDERSRNDIALSATLREAAPYQKIRRRKLEKLQKHKSEKIEKNKFQNVENYINISSDQYRKKEMNLKVLVESSDFHFKVRSSKVGGKFLFIVDGSASMASYNRLVAAREAMERLLLDAYQKRDQVALIVFRGETAELIVPFTNSIDRVRRELKHISIGGKTPLQKGLELGYQVLLKESQRVETFIGHVIIVTDGRLTGGDIEKGRNEALFWAKQLGMITQYVTVLDTEQKRLPLGLCKDIAKLTQGFYCDMKDIQSETILRAIKNTRKV